MIEDELLVERAEPTLVVAVRGRHTPPPVFRAVRESLMADAGSAGAGSSDKGSVEALERWVLPIEVVYVVREWGGAARSRLRAIARRCVCG